MLIATAHSFFFYFTEESEPTEVKDYGNLPKAFHPYVVIPIILIGFGHALQATLGGPMVNKIVPDKKEQARALSTMKIFEGSSIAFFTYVNGHMRQASGNYNAVGALTVINCVIGMTCAFILD